MAETVTIIVNAKDNASKVLGGISGMFSGIAKVAGGILAANIIQDLGRQVIDFGKDSIQAASDLSETANKINVVFGDASDAVNDFASDAASSFGQSKQQALDAAATFGVFGKAAGLAGGDLADFSTDLTGLSSDMASFYNTSPDEAIQAIGAALRGESEPIRKYGVLLDDASMRQKALEMGLISTTKNALTPQQKVLAAQALIFEQTADAQGDFARTSDGLANSQRILTAQFENIKTQLGSAFLPVVTQVASAFSNWLSNPATQAGIQNMVAWIGTNLPVAVQYLSDMWTGTLQPAIAVVWAWMSTVLIPFIQNEVVPWLQVNIPIAIQTLSDFWTNTLQPAIAEVWNWMSTVLIPFLQNVVVPWLQVNIPIALQTLSDFWTNVLKPAILAVWGWMSTVLIPFLETKVFPWLQEKIPAALQTLSDFWTDTLLPAITDVWTFLTVDMMPIWEALGELLIVVVGKAIETVTILWNEGLLPAMTTVWKFIVEKLIPKVKDMTSSFGSARDVIQKVADFISAIADAVGRLDIGKLLQLMGVGGGGGGGGGSTKTPGQALSEVAKQELKYGQDFNGNGSVGRAFGGPVTANTPYLVGENGPELFVPRSNGEIVNNYNLTINEAGARGNVVNDFGLLRAMSGA